MFQFKQSIWANAIDYVSSAEQKVTLLPATWDDMQDQLLKVVELKPETKEYKEVQEKFLQTCQSLKVEKVKACHCF